MAIRLYVVANLVASPDGATLTNTEHPDDTTKIPPASSLVHTGGKDGNFIRVPDCSEEKYYADHHILIQGKDWQVTLWDNDAEDHMLYWNNENSYSVQHPIAGSGNSNYENFMLLVSGRGRGVEVNVFPY